MTTPAIRVRGARTHNLKDVDVDIPRDALTVVCGVSGSGKSSLVLDTLGVEARRRFLGTLERASAEHDAGARPDVDSIEGLPPAVVAGFLARAPSSRVTLGTLTEVTGALRALFARVGVPHCPDCSTPVVARTREAVTADLLARRPGTRVVLLATHGHGPAAWVQAQRDGFVRARVGSGPVQRVEDVDARSVGDDDEVSVVVDRLVVKAGAAERFAASVEQGLGLGGGLLRALVDGDSPGDEEEITFADRPYCGSCGSTWPPLSTSLFSFDSPRGACPTCEGRGEVLRLDPERVLPRRTRVERVPAHLDRHLDAAGRKELREALTRLRKRFGVDGRRRLGTLPEEARHELLEGRGRRRGLRASWARGEVPARLASPQACPDCRGRRLAPYPAAVQLAGATLPALEAQPVAALATWLSNLALDERDAALAGPALRDARARIAFLLEVELGYLALARPAASLSGGELRRARLAAACAARMSGLLFLLDEPTSGLHPIERPRLRERLRDLVREGNTVVCVEHDPEMLAHADHVVELGPGAGLRGGHVLCAADATTVLRERACPLAEALASPPPALREKARAAAGALRLRGVRWRTLRDLDVAFPHHALTCITGVSGAGKSTLLLDVIAPAARAALGEAAFPADRLDAIEGARTLTRVSVARGRAPRHPRATPATVLGIDAKLRGVFAATLEARARGWTPARFSRHVRGGRCEACAGTGRLRVALRDLAAVSVTCDACDGAGFASDTLEVKIKGLSIADVAALTLEEAATLFRDFAPISRALAAATEVGLGYIPLGEATSRMSGGEALRLRLAAALGRGRPAETLYLLDEPSAGLHPVDVGHLAEVLLRLAADGNTVICVEHHPLLVRQADHVVELGPGPGEEGGRLLYAGPPAGLLGVAGSPTGAWLRGA